MKRWTGQGRLQLLTVVGLVALGLWASGTTAGAGARFPEAGLSPTAGIAEEPAQRVGEAFYDANYGHFNWDGIGTIVLSANEDGTGSTLVDDKILIKVVHTDGTTSIRLWIRSNGAHQISERSRMLRE